MAKLIKRSVLLIAVMISAIFLFSVAVRAEIINPTAKEGLVENGEALVLINPGELTAGDEKDRYFEYKFENEDDSAFTKDVWHVSAKEVGTYNVEWQLITLRNDDKTVLDAGVIESKIAGGQSPVVNTGLDDHQKTIIGVSAMLLAVIVIMGAVMIKSKVGE